MDALTQAADWANIAATVVFIGLVAVGAPWWYWKRYKHRQNMEKQNAFLIRRHEYADDMRKSAVDILQNEASSNEARTRSILLSIHATLEAHYYFTAFNYIAMNQSLSYLPDWMKERAIQWPVKKKSEGPDSD